MEISIREKGSHKIIAIDGEVDLYNVGKLKAEIIQLVGEQVKSLVIDMNALNYMDSSGIALMANLQKKMKSQNGTFTIININKDVMNVLKLAALDKFFHILESEDQLR